MVVVGVAEEEVAVVISISLTLVVVLVRRVLVRRVLVRRVLVSVSGLMEVMGVVDVAELIEAEGDAAGWPELSVDSMIPLVVLEV